VIWAVDYIATIEGLRLINYFIAIICKDILGVLWPLLKMSKIRTTVL